jgi:hypothetical protein
MVVQVEAWVGPLEGPSICSQLLASLNPNQSTLLGEGTSEMKGLVAHCVVLGPLVLLIAPQWRCVGDTALLF